MNLHVDRSDTFRSLRNRNYRAFLVGQFLSQCGTWMQTVAQSWLVLKLSDNSGFAVGLALALQYLPMTLLSMWGGLLADRIPKRRLIVVVETVMALAAGALALITITGVVELWMVYALVTLLGVGSAFDLPARQAFITEIVGEDDLMNAIAINGIAFHSARIFGPSLAGILLVTLGTGPCFAVNALSFAAMIAGLLAIRTSELHQAPITARAKGQLREGLDHIRRTPVLRLSLVQMAVVGAFALNFPVVLPLAAKLTFAGDPKTFGFMSAAMGVGAMLGSFIVAANSRRKVTVLSVAQAALLFGGSMCVVALAPTLATFLIVLVALGATMILLTTRTNTLVQISCAPHLRGRVMAVYLLTALGATPIGGPLVGLLSERAGPRWALALGGSATFATAVWLVLRARADADRPNRATIPEPRPRSRADVAPAPTAAPRYDRAPSKRGPADPAPPTIIGGTPA